MKTLHAVVSGSFRRHLSEIQQAVAELTDRGVKVLSPADPRVVDEFGDFLFVASDRLRSIHAVESRHLTAIRSADFLWLVDPDGYVGPSASMELGFALAAQTPIFTSSTPNDLTLRQYVRTVSVLSDAIRETCRSRPTPPLPLIVDPQEGAQQLHSVIDRLERQLTAPVGHTKEQELLDAYFAARRILELP